MQLRHLLNQSFQVFDLYGREPEYLTAIFQAFATALKDETEANITAAFLTWLRDKTEMPKPAEIRALCAGYVAARHKSSGFQGRAQMDPAPEREKVSWAYLQWQEFTDQHKRDLADHLKTLSPIEAHRYQKFLRSHFGYPYNVAEGGRDDE